MSKTLKSQQTVDDAVIWRSDSEMFITSIVLWAADQKMLCCG